MLTVSTDLYITLSLSLYSLIVDVSAVDTGLLSSGAREGNSGNLRPSDTAPAPEPEVG